MKSQKSLKKRSKSDSFPKRTKREPQRFLPEVGFVRLETILCVMGISRNSWLRGVAAGKYPRPVRLGARSVAWRVSDVREVIEKINSGDSAA